MSTLTKIKGKVVNPNLPVLTKYGLLSQIVGKYANKLDAVDVVLTQTELDALGAFITALKEGDVLEHITAFYPFIGNPNIPLIGSKDLTISNITDTNTNLVFENGRLKGEKGLPKMPTVKLLDLIPNAAEYGLMLGGSVYFALPSTGQVPRKVIAFSDESNTSRFQYRIHNSGDGTANFCYYQFDASEQPTSANLYFAPSLIPSQTANNYCFAHGLSSSIDAYLRYNNTLIKNGQVLANTAARDIENTKIVDTSFFNNAILGETTTQKGYTAVFTTLAFFDSILTKNQSLVFCQALDTFTAAVGKTVSVG